ncbi:MAG: DUF3450 family protein [Planctomycetota bacterium]
MIAIPRFLIPMLFAALWARAPAAEQEAVPVAEAVLRDLRAADVARAEQARERAAWQRERERMEALIATLEQEAGALEQRAGSDRAAVAQLERATADSEELRARRERLEAELAALAAETRAILDARADSMLPGVIPAPETDAADVPDDAAVHAFAAAVRRLDRALAASAEVAVGIEDGTLADGSQRAVEVLRCGAVMAWWRALDGDAAGVVRMDDGRVLLEPRDDPAEARAIATAIEIAAGRAAPELVLLPFGAADVIDGEAAAAESRP